MNGTIPATADTGLEVTDIFGNAAFAARQDRHRDAMRQMEGMRRIARAFVENPDSILQGLVEAAVELCGADSAGISIEKRDGTDRDYYRWAATAGQYSDFLGAILPRYPSACGICLERGQPQLFRVGQRFFDILGVSAPLVTDGILLPWEVDDTRGTIFIMAHGRAEAFDQSDCRLMQLLADFAALGVRQQRQQKMLVDQAAATAAAAMANELAHQINNPLQGLTNLLYLAAKSEIEEQAETGRKALTELLRLSALVGQLLTIPYPKSKEATGHRNI